MRLFAMKDVLVAVLLLGSVAAVSVEVARGIGDAYVVMRTCDGRGKDARCR